jgi:hypothetical protein
MNPMAFVNVRFNDVERGLSEADARFVAEQLRIRRGEHHSVALELAERIERQAEAPTFAAPERDVELDEKEKVELVEALDALELDAQLTGHVQSLRRALRGERWPGEEDDSPTT